jgi:DNA replication initiation complex subunit (GINS family)
MKRLVIASENVDNLFSAFKEIVSVDDIASKIQEVYTAWDEAKENNQQLNGENYLSIEDWFDSYYSSVIADCIKDAKDDYEFNEKYNNLTTSEEEELEERVDNFIVENKSTIISTIENINIETEEM